MRTSWILLAGLMVGAEAASAQGSTYVGVSVDRREVAGFFGADTPQLSVLVGQRLASIHFAEIKVGHLFEERQTDPSQGEAPLTARVSGWALAASYTMHVQVGTAVRPYLTIGGDRLRLTDSFRSDVLQWDRNKSSLWGAHAGVGLTVESVWGLWLSAGGEYLTLMKNEERHPRALDPEGWSLTGSIGIGF